MNQTGLPCQIFDVALGIDLSISSWSLSQMAPKAGACARAYSAMAVGSPDPDCERILFPPLKKFTLGLVVRRECAPLVRANSSALKDSRYSMLLPCSLGWRGPCHPP